jgi:hypothetical protein
LIEGDPDIDVSRSHGLNDLIASGSRHFEGHTGMNRSEPLDPKRDKAMDQRLDRADPDVPTPQVLERIELGAHSFDFERGRAHVPVERLASWGKDDTPRASFEQRDPKIVLKRLDLPAHRRLRNVQNLRRRPDRAMLHNCPKIPDRGLQHSMSCVTG